MEVRITSDSNYKLLEEDLVGRKIVGVATDSDCLLLALDNGKTLQVTFKGDIGADGGWYDFLFAKVYKETK